MNESLHLGHAFSLSKIEFAAGYHRLRGANVLFPIGFHCTGMPIKASADILGRDMQQSHQWDTLRSYGLSDAEISTFQDPNKWLSFFPPLAVNDLKAFGLGCDWRRSFVTTDSNPYFDTFIRWQMRKLKSIGKMVKDLRYTIYSPSPLENQPCGDHDRAIGQGVRPMDYTLIKMEIVPPYPPKLRTLEGKRRVFLAATTLRPETMFGQTNAWVFPDGMYGAFEINETDVFILTPRAALNLSYQNYSRFGQMPSCLVELTGSDLIGLQLRSPLSLNEIIYALPRLTMETDKGTGILTSVPSDDPYDYTALHELKSKSVLRARYGVRDEWVRPFKSMPIINIPEFGDKIAEKVCIDMNIKNQNDEKKLEEAKSLTYLKGFTEGTMLVNGEFAGGRVKEVQPLIRKMLIETGQAILYCEPEERVMSKSGYECVVALTDQWYLTYGEVEWRKLAEECLADMNLHSEETRHSLEHTLSWLNQWACSRSFGLGTRLPWDDQYLVDSLSDSTIYMAYYTVAHLLHAGDMYGSTTSSTVKPEQMTDEVWEFIFCGGSYPESADIPSSMLKKMKQEFEYWYPFDLRVSGKELLQNHLTFCIYNHTAIFSKNHWPRGFRCNGHIMVNAEKMSKSRGNFRTLRQAIEDFSADATRFTLADAGDSLDDANFVTRTANAAILRLTKEISWIEEILTADAFWRTGPPSTYADRVFANEINIAVKMTDQNYREYMFREALKTGYYDLQAARDEYRFSCGAGGMNQDLVWRFLDVHTRLIAPICPHYAEYVWKELLRKDGFVVKAGWPAVDDQPDLTLKKANKYLQDSIVLMRKLLQKQILTQDNRLTGLIYVNEQYDGWKAECLRILQSKFDKETRCLAPDQEIFEALRMSEVGRQAANFEKTLQLCMPFLKFKKDEAIALGVHAFDLNLAIGEIDVLQENFELIKRQLGLEEMEILSATDPDALARAGQLVSLLNQNPPSPGNPTAIFFRSP